MSDREHTTVIGPDTFIKGEMVFEHAATVLGRFEGRIASKGELVIGETSNCKASIDAARIVIDGAVEGDLIARERLELNPGAVVTGDIVAAKLVAAEGASFVGHCRVGEAAVKAAKEPGASIPIDQARAATAKSAKPQTQAPPAATGGDLESTLAGFEAKLAEFSRTKAATGT